MASKGYITVAHFSPDLTSPLQDAQDFQDDLDDTHRVVEDFTNGGIYVEELTDHDHTKWVRIADIDPDYDDTPAAAEHLADALDPDDFRVIRDCSNGDWQIEVKRGE